MATKKTAAKRKPIKKCAPTERGPKAYARNVKDANHKPKVVAARFVKDWKKALGRGVQVCAVKAEATLPRGWDYGFYGLFEITLADGAALRAAVSIHYDGPSVRDFNRPGAVTVEASGNVALDADYGGVVAVARGSSWDQVEGELIRQTASHLAPTAKAAAKKAKPKPAAKKAKPKPGPFDTPRVPGKTVAPRVWGKKITPDMVLATMPARGPVGFEKIAGKLDAAGFRVSETGLSLVLGWLEKRGKVASTDAAGIMHTRAPSSGLHALFYKKLKGGAVATKKKATKKKATKRKAAKVGAAFKESLRRRGYVAKRGSKSGSYHVALAVGPHKGDVMWPDRTPSAIEDLIRKQGNTMPIIKAAKGKAGSYSPTGKRKAAPKRKASKKRTAPASLFESYYTVVIPYSKEPTKWHPPNPGAKLTRGAHEKRADAVAWAKSNLRGQPYTITAHEDVNRPKASWYRQADDHALERVIAMGGDVMKKAARAEKRRRKEGAGPRQGSLAFGNGNGKRNGNGNGGKSAGTTARERAIRDWMK